MKKKVSIIAVFFVSVLMYGCGCKHEFATATCNAPATCTICGEESGEPNWDAHEWTEATCDAPKKCKVCGKTEGEPNGHEWTEATCDAPKKCKVCGKTEGEPNGHEWTEATYSTPKTCQICGTIEGERKPAPTWESGNIKKEDMDAFYEYALEFGWAYADVKVSSRLIRGIYKGDIMIVVTFTDDGAPYCYIADMVKSETILSERDIKDLTYLYEYVTK